MKCGEMIEYLEQFDPEDGVMVVVVDPESRLFYKAYSYELCNDCNKAALLFKVSKVGSVDDDSCINNKAD